MSRQPTCRAYGASFTSAGLRSDHHLIKSSAQVFITPIYRIAKSALNVLGEAAVTDAYKRRSDKADRWPTRGNACGNLDHRAENMPQLCGIQAPPCSCTLRRAWRERVQEGKNLLEYLAPFFGLREALNRAQILSAVR